MFVPGAKAAPDDRVRGRRFLNLAERIASVALLAMAAGLMGLSLTLNYISDGVPGPGFAPLWYGIVLLASSALLAVQVWRDRARSPGEPLIQDASARARVLKYAAGTVAAVALASWIGLLPALVLFLTYFVRAEGRAPWTQALLIGVGVPVLFWLTFGLLLGVDFPWGLFGS